MKPIAALWRAIQAIGGRLFSGVSVSSVGVSIDEVALVAKTMRAKKGPQNVMIDVGAHFGFSLSPFVELGWSVYAFEPDSENRAQLERRFENIPALVIDKRALSEEPSSSQSFFRSPISTGISSLLAFHVTHQHGEDVEVTTLAQVLDEFDVDHVDVLKVDVEGLDLHVLKGNDWTKSIPEIVVCEFEDRKTLKVGYSFDDLCRFLIDRSYYLVISEWYPVREYGTQHRFKRVGVYPIRRRDPNSWGNIVAARSRVTQFRVFLRMWAASVLGRLLSYGLNKSSSI